MEIERCAFMFSKSSVRKNCCHMGLIRRLILRKTRVTVDTICRHFWRGHELRRKSLKIAAKCFDQVLALGFREDHDLVLQMGRALFREGLIEPARTFFELAVEHHAESSEAAACLGYARHRLGDEASSLHWLRRARPWRRSSAHVVARPSR